MSHHSPLRLAPGVLALVLCVAVLVQYALGAVPGWGAAIAAAILLGPFLLGYGVVGLMRWRARRVAGRLMRLAETTAAAGQASLAEWDEGRALAADLVNRVNAITHDAVRGPLLAALVRGGPLRGECARAAARLQGPDPRLEEALVSDLEGLQSIESVEAVAGWLASYGQDHPDERLLELVAAAPPETRREALHQLLLLLGPPDEAKAARIRPYTDEVLGLVRNADLGRLNPNVSRWRDYLKQRKEESR